MLNKPANEFDNDTLVEELWAAKAFEHAQVYFNVSDMPHNDYSRQLSHIPMPFDPFSQLLCSVDPRGLRLTPHDDEIYAAFRQEFPALNVDRLNEDELKTEEAKTRWRSFIEKFNKLEDFSFGTIIRANASEEFNPYNSILVIRLQFWALEIARNREGHNDDLRKLFQATQVPTVVEE